MHEAGGRLTDAKGGNSYEKPEGTKDIPRGRPTQSGEGLGNKKQTHTLTGKIVELSAIESFHKLYGRRRSAAQVEREF